MAHGSEAVALLRVRENMTFGISHKRRRSLKGKIVWSQRGCCGGT